MAHFQDCHIVPEVSQTDEFGNPIRRTDEFGNPIRRTDKFGNPIPKHETDRGIAGVGGHHYREHHGLHRTGSSSSSSSEDEGTGRKKKGLKEKLPGEHKQHQPQATSTTTPGQGPMYQEQKHHEKKGLMDKIKEKLPGHHSP